jgi:hypothetical protein
MTTFIAITAPLNVGDGCDPQTRNIGNFRSQDQAQKAIDTFLANNPGHMGWIHTLQLSARHFSTR